MQLKHGWLLGIFLLGVIGRTAHARDEAAEERDIVARAGVTLCAKQVALLAELPSHGEGRALALKAAIARQLVERCGFEVLLIEAPIYEFLALEPRWRTGQVRQSQLDRAIGKFWWARELREFRGWLHAQASAGELHLGGIDDQVSITSDHANERLSELVGATDAGSTYSVDFSQGKGRRASERIDCAAAVKRHLQWQYDDDRPFDTSEQMKLLVCVESAIRDHTDDPIAARMLDNFKRYVARQSGRFGWQSRDSSMFQNLDWHLQRWLPTTKVIVWTATVHASKSAYATEARPLGNFLREEYGSRVGVVAFSAYSGQSSMAGREPTTFTAAPKSALEAISFANNADAGLAFLDVGQLGELGVVGSRLLGKFTRANWSSSFDAVVVVREETPAQFEALE